MRQHLTQLSFGTRGQGLYEVTDRVRSVVAEAAVRTGLCTVFVRHTSASLTIQENASPAARADLEDYLKMMVPEDYPHFTHTEEGPDDMPAHIKAALTATSLGIPIDGGRMVLGTWQGIFLWEHRSRPHQRRLTVHVVGD